MGALYRVGSRLFEAGFAAFGIDLRSIGHENIPAEGPAVLAINHVGYLDFALAALAPPRPRREVRYLARRDFFEKPITGRLLYSIRQIPVDVHGDPRQAAEVAQAALEAGDIVGIHPEGTISPSFVPRRGKSGAVRLADSAQAPIVPVGIWGSQRLLTKGRPARPSRGVVVLVRYGEPFRPSGRTGMARTKELMTRIDALVQRNQLEYPQRPVPGDDWWLPAHLGGSAPTPEEAELALAAQEEERRTRRRSELGG